jgi:hypothetical protein
MATLTDEPEFTSNEVYAIQQTDPVEGAAAGASNGGIGLSNVQGQQLANRTAFLKGRQDINIQNIQSIANFIAGLTGALGPEGWIGIPFTDVNLGERIFIFQWGYALGPSALVTVTWPHKFPTICYAGWCSTNRSTPGSQGFNHTAEVSPTQGQFVFDTTDSSGGQHGGFWFALGF